MATTQKKQQRRSGGNTARNRSTARRSNANRAGGGSNLGGPYSGAGAANVQQDIEAVGRLMTGFVSGHRNVPITSITAMQLLAWGEEYGQRQQRGGNRSTTGNQVRRGQIETPAETEQPKTRTAATGA